MSADYDVGGRFDYQPVKGNLEDLQLKALQNRPDLRAAQQGVTAAKSQYELQKAIGKHDVTVSGQLFARQWTQHRLVLWKHSAADFRPQPGRNRARTYAITQAQEQQKAASEQVLTDVHDAYEGLRTNDKVVTLIAPAISMWRRKTATSANTPTSAAPPACWIFWTPSAAIAPPSSPTGKRLAAYLLALEQLREAVGLRDLP